MDKLSLENIEKIITHEYVLPDVENVNEVSLNGISFLEVEHSYLGTLEKVCVRTDSVTRIEYKQMEEA